MTINAGARRKVPARFDAASPFEVEAVPAALSRRNLERKLDQLKLRLVSQHLFASDEPGLPQLLQRAASDAIALAAATPYALLVLPVLFEESLERARLQAQRQEQIHRRSEKFLEFSV